MLNVHGFVAPVTGAPSSSFHCRDLIDLAAEREADALERADEWNPHSVVPSVGVRAAEALSRRLAASDRNIRDLRYPLAASLRSHFQLCAAVTSGDQRAVSKCIDRARNLPETRRDRGKRERRRRERIAKIATATPANAESSRATAAQTLAGLVTGDRFTAELQQSKPEWERGRTGCRFCRHLFIDVEQQGGGFAVVFRSEDKVKAGAGRSRARNAEDRKFHRAPMYYCDESGAPRRFVLWCTSDGGARELATAIAREVLAFWRVNETAFVDRWTELSPDAQPVVAALLAIFGGSGPSGAIGSYHDRPGGRKTVTLAPVYAAAERRATSILRAAISGTPDITPQARAQIDQLVQQVEG